MSEYAGELRVKIIPDTTSFGPQLQEQMQQAGPRGAPGSLLERSGIGQNLRDQRALGTELGKTLEKEQQLVAKQQQMRQTSIGNAAAFGILGFAVRGLVQDFGQWASAQDGVVGGLGKIATGVSNLDLVTTGKGIGETARLLLDPSAGASQDRAKAAEQEVTDRQNAITLAKQLLDLRERTAKAEGQVGTAAGATRYQLERQLAAAQLGFSQLPSNLRRIAGGQLGLDENLNTNQALAGRNPVQLTDQDRSAQYQIAQAKAARASNEQQQIALARDRSSALQSEISRLEGQVSQTTEDRQKLAGLYGELATVENTVSSLQEQARAARRERIANEIQSASVDLQINLANARSASQTKAAVEAQASFEEKEAQDTRITVQERQQHALSAAGYRKQLYDIGVGEREAAKQAAAEALRQRQEELQAERQRYRATLSLNESRLQNRTAQAQLTDKSLKDDRKAIRAEIAFYKREANDTKLSVSERVAYRGRQIGAMLQLKNLSPAAAQASKPEDFFREAASQFKAYGSNISGAGGPLSGQDARAKYAAGVLSSKAGQRFAHNVEQVAKAGENQLLVEQQRQTALLKVIADGIRKYGTPGPVADSIKRARGHALAMGGR